MLEIVDFKVRSLDVDRNELSWAVSGNSDPLDYSVVVLRSESPEGPFDPITGAFEDRYLFVDARIPAGDRYRQLWYRLSMTEKATSVVAVTPSVCRQAEPDLIASYVRRDEMTRLTQVTGRLCWLFKVRTFGMRCVSCRNEVSGRKERSSCLDCFNTGYLRGYHNPIETWVQIDPAAKSQQLQAQQIDQQQFTSARTGFYPNISVGDLIVEAENIRWRIQSISQSERLRAVVKQELALRRLQDSDIEMRLPINLEGALRDIQPSPGRMFTNPVDINSAILERTPNVFANYTTYPRVTEE